MFIFKNIYIYLLISKNNVLFIITDILHYKIYNNYFEVELK